MRQRKCPVCRLAEHEPIHDACHMLLQSKLREKLINIEWKIFKLEMMYEEKHRKMMDMLQR